MKQVLVCCMVLLSFSTFSQTLQPDDQTGLVSVKVTDYKDKVRVGEEIIFYGVSSKKSYSGISDSRGNFDIKLPKGETFRILISAFGEQKEYSTLTIPQGRGLVTGELIVKFELPAQITLEDVLFESGSAKLNPSSYKSLDELAAFMKRKTDMEIEIAGHTDNVGNESNNLVLSQKRSESVRNYLISKGISPTRLVAKGYGQSEPVADNDSDGGRRQNRRTEVRIIKE
jgi:outer membrane protein OmpA-like peptidoglycan-associated protein